MGGSSHPLPPPPHGAGYAAVSRTPFGDTAVRLRFSSRRYGIPPSGAANEPSLHHPGCSVQTAGH
jgi:hypothetical protein